MFNESIYSELMQLGPDPARSASLFYRQVFCAPNAMIIAQQTASKHIKQQYDMKHTF